jgi:hypothetical protein
MDVMIQAMAGFSVVMALFYFYKEWSRIRRRAARLSRRVKPGGSSAPMYAQPAAFCSSSLPGATHRARPEEEELLGELSNGVD